MSGSIYRRDTCRLCHSTHLSLVLHFTPTPPVESYVRAERLNEVQATYPIDVFFCHNCGHVHLLDVIGADTLFRDFIEPAVGASPRQVAYFRDYADDVIRWADPPAGALAVDIRSNDGTLLRFFREHGMQVLGIESTWDLAQQATESGVETVPYPFNSKLARRIREERGPAALIIANRVLSHNDNLDDIMKGVCNLLAPDGTFIFEVCYLASIIQNRVFDWFYHEHLSYHSVKPLMPFFHRHGMKLVDIERIPYSVGNLRGVAQFSNASGPPSPSVGAFVDDEAQLGIDRIEGLEAFTAEVEAAKTRLLGLLLGLRAQGKTFAGFGASATVTTLVHHFGLGDILSFVVDDNPDRQGLFSPGHHIPVLPPQAIYDRKPDYVVVLAWRFAEPIIEKHQAFLIGGGRFIVPLPTVEVV